MEICICYSVSTMQLSTLIKRNAGARVSDTAVEAAKLLDVVIARLGLEAAVRAVTCGAWVAVVDRSDEIVATAHCGLEHETAVYWIEADLVGQLRRLRALIPNTAAAAAA